MGKLGGIILLATLALSSSAAASAPEPDPAVASSYVSSYSADEFFIAGVKTHWQGAKPSNTALVGIGEAYCRTGVAPEGVNGKTVAEYATVTYCPKR
jgi:hypothetical protein